MKREKINIELPESVINFLNYCRNIKGLSEKTALGYENDLKMFVKFLKDNRGKDRHAINDKYIKTIKLKHLHNFMNYLIKECDNKASTRCRKVATLKAYFEYLQNKERLITFNPAYELESPKQPKTEPITLSLNQAIKLLESLDKSSINYYRDKCILNIFLHCGLRISELANIKIKDIKDGKIKIWGKGAKERFVYLDDTCKKAIEEYLNYRFDEDYPENIKQYLFLSRTYKTKISTDAIRSMVKKYLNIAELTDEKYTPHKLRGTFATLNHNAGANIRQIQRALGHSSIKTTERYLRVEEEELRDMATNNPLNNL
jgi:integrase/recombinase XerD